jgi:hypothetical protein
MAHKTFISYKYSESTQLRDDIIESLGDDSTYYKGENVDSPDLTEDKKETIREYLKNMIYDTSVMIVIISPNMKDSDWIEWEIKYALKDIKRGDKTSHSNGVLGVIMNDPDSSWFRYSVKKDDGDVSSQYNTHYAVDIINKNRFNQNPVEYSCEHCKTVNGLTGSYISFVSEDDFLNDPTLYIDNAYEKSQNLDNYIIEKDI